MSESHPGKPLNTSDLPSNQGINQTISVPAYYGVPSSGYIQGFQSFFGNIVQIDKQTYACKEMTFSKQSIDYKP